MFVLDYFLKTASKLPDRSVASERNKNDAACDSDSDSDNDNNIA